MSKPKTTVHATKKNASKAKEKPKTAPKRSAGTTAAAEKGGRTARPGRDEKTPPARRHETRARKLLTRFETLGRKLGKWNAGPNTPANVMSLIAACDAIIDDGKALMLAFKKIPDDFVPPRAVAASRTLDVGAIVSITDKAKPSYDGLVEDAHMTDLTVKAVVGSKVKCVAKDGAVLIFPRSHLMAKKAA